MVLINILSVALLVTAIELGWPLAVGLAAAVGVGLGFSLAGSAVRGALDAPAERISLLQTAFALEAMLDEVVFIVGPVLVTSSPPPCTRRSESASALSSADWCCCPGCSAHQPAADPVDAAGA